MSVPENPCAFPSPMIPECSEGASGMTLRDWFAGQAVSGYIAHGSRTSAETIASEAYILADAMLAERAKGGGA